jgi:hypothetical protein
MAIFTYCFVLLVVMPCLLYFCGYLSRRFVTAMMTRRLAARRADNAPGFVRPTDLV